MTRGAPLAGRGQDGGLLVGGHPGTWLNSFGGFGRPEGQPRVVSQWARRPPELDLTGMAVFGRIYRLARLADRMRSAALERHDLQLGDVDVMAALWRHDGGLRPLDLRASMLIGSGTLTARLDRLESAGLFERRPAQGPGAAGQ